MADHRIISPCLVRYVKLVTRSIGLLAELGAIADEWEALITEGAIDSHEAAPTLVALLESERLIGQTPTPIPAELRAQVEAEQQWPGLVRLTDEEKAEVMEKVRRGEAYVVWSEADE